MAVYEAETPLKSHFEGRRREEKRLFDQNSRFVEVCPTIKFEKLGQKFLKAEYGLIRYNVF